MLDAVVGKLEDPRYRGFVEDVIHGRKYARFVASAGAIIIFVTTVAGVELGPRHAKDVNELLQIAKKHKERKK